MATKTYLLDGASADNTAEEFGAVMKLLLAEGVFNDQSNNDDLQVVERGAGANMSVDVSLGKALVEYLKDSVTWKVIVDNAAVENLVISANSSGDDRVDAVVVALSQDEPNALKNNVATIVVVEGTGNTALTDGAIDTDLGHTNWYRLANVTVPDSAASITDSDIEDTRTPVAIGISGGGYDSVFLGNVVTTDTTVFVKRDGSLAFTADQSMGSNKLTDVTDPTDPQDAATRAWVQSQVPTNLEFEADGAVTELAPVKIVDFDLDGTLQFSELGETLEDSLPHTIGVAGDVVFATDTLVFIAESNSGNTSLDVRVYTFDPADASLTLIDSLTIAGAFSSAGGEVHGCKVTDTKVAFLTEYGGANNAHLVCVELVSGTTLSSGSFSAVPNGRGAFHAFYIEDGAFIVFTGNNGNTNTYAHTYTVTGTTLSHEDAQSLSFYDNGTPHACVASSDNFTFFAGCPNTNTEDYDFRALEVSDDGSYTITAGSNVNISVGTASGNFKVGAIIQSGGVDVIVAYQNSGSSNHVAIYSLSGTTLTSKRSYTTDYSLGSNDFVVIGQKSIYQYGSTSDNIISLDTFDAVSVPDGSMNVNTNDRKISKSTDGKNYLLFSASADDYVFSEFDWGEFVGLANETVDDGVSVGCYTEGDIVSGLSSLELSRSYYLQEDGSIDTTTNDFPVYKSYSVDTAKMNNNI